MEEFWGVEILLVQSCVGLQAEKAEKEKMKQVVLGIHERQEEEDYQGNHWPITFQPVILKPSLNSPQNPDIL